MELNLTRGDLLQLDPISCRNTIRLLPIGKKKKQKLVIGDDSGHIGCYEFKKGEPQTVFIARPFEGPVTSVVLGGDQLKSDKIFAAHGQQVIGMTKKGKDFFKLTSALTEPIQNMIVDDTKIWTGCEFIFNLYDNGKDTAFYMSRDHINALVVVNISSEHEKDAVIGCQDGVVRVLQGSKSILEIPLGAPVTALSILHFDVPGCIRNAKDPIGLVFGLSNGKIGVIKVEKKGDLSWDIVWTVADARKSPITAIKVYDLSKVRGTDFIFGREDGRLEVYSTGPGSGEGGNFTEPDLTFSYDIGESVRGIDAGFVNSTDYAEIVCGCYSGKIISFTSEPVMKRAQDDTYGRSVQKINDENRIKNLRKEIDALKLKLTQDRDKLKKVSTKAIDMTATVSQDFSVNARFGLDEDHSAYSLSIELQTPIELVVIKSAVLLTILDSEESSCSVYVTPPSADADENSRYVAICKVQNKEKRLNLLIRTTEGEYGEMFVTVVNSALPKAAKVLRYSLKPLSLQFRVHNAPEADLARPRSHVVFKGSVGALLLHDWAVALFFDIPPKADEDEAEQMYTFKNVFTGAVSIVSYRVNELRFESESASTIAIVKECVGRFATSRRVQLQESISSDSVNDSAAMSLMQLLRPKIEYQLSLLYKMDIMEACQEIIMEEMSGAGSGGDNAASIPSWLDKNYADILKNKEQIKAEFKLREKSLEYLTGIVTDLFVDWNKLKGVDSRHQIADMTRIIMSPQAKFDDLLAMFTSKSTLRGHK